MLRRCPLRKVSGQLAEAWDGMQTEQVPGKGLSSYPGAFCDMCFVSYATRVGKCLGEQVTRPRAAAFGPAGQPLAKLST